MKKILLKTFCLGSLLIGSIFSLNSNAQIVYTDVNPDVTSSGTYNLDLNNDGTIDFIIQHTSSTVNGKGNCKGQSATNHYIKVTPLNSSQVLDTGTDPKRMLPNTIINSTVSSWSNLSNQLMISYEPKCTYYCFYYQCGYAMLPTVNGQWYPGTEDGYLGLRLNYGGHSYFGWARMNTSDGGVGFTIKDYAINTNADQAIFAGHTSLDYLEISPIPLGNSYFCAGNSTVISYIIYGQFAASNIVAAELSDVNGSFANPVAIGSTVSNVSGNISAVIPGSTPSGNGYRVRVSSSNPIHTSNSTAFPMYIKGPPYALIGGDTNICKNGSANLVSYDDTPYPDACISYQWRLNGNSIPGATASSYTATTAGNYTCIKTNGAVTVTSNVKNVIANPIPAIIQASPGPVVCGGTVYLSNTGMSGTYQWKLNGNSIPGATAIDYNPAVPGSYYCVVTNTCGSFSSNTINVSINPPMPAATITSAGPSVICSGPVTLNANTAAGLTYQWYNKDEWNATNTIVPGATSSSYVASSDGNYFVIETNGNGCTQTSNSILVLIGTPPIPTVEPLSASICNGNSIPLHVLYFNTLVGYASPPYSYQWFKNGVAIAGATTYYYMANHQGTYTVRASASGGCSSVSAPMIVTNGCNTRVTASRSSNNNESVSPGLNDIKFRVYPNPVSSSATISFSLLNAGKVSINLYDLTGRLINTLTDKNFDEGVHQITFDTKELNAGIYLLRLQSPGTVETKKVVVIK